MRWRPPGMRQAAGQPEVGTLPDLTGLVSFTNCSRSASMRCVLSSIPDLCSTLGLRIVVVSRIDIQHHDFVVVTPNHRLAGASFILEAGEHTAIPDLNECPSAKSGVRPWTPIASKGSFL
jgi:hypothetical protein